MYDIALALVLLLAVFLGFLLSRTLQELRALGISDKQPGCGRCRYSLRGWNSPTCPECGSDVRKVGVITGSQWTRPLGNGIVLCLSLLALGVGIRVAALPRPIEFAEVERRWQSNSVSTLSAELK